jgi:photosystem II stability/assembly factor-like uncharacterized protein
MDADSIWRKGIAMVARILFVLMLVIAGATDHWKRVAVPATASLRGLSAVDAKIVWASGTGGTVIRTVDGGDSWVVRTVLGAEKLDFRGIRAFDADSAVVMSSGKAEDGLARLYRTSDGGKNWELVHQATTPGVFFDAIAFWDRQHGIVLSDPVSGHFWLLRTEDGGATWKQIPAAILPPALKKEGAFAASNSCLAIEGAQNVWFGTGGATVARVFRSRDRGESWAVSETPMRPGNASSGIFSLAFRDARNGMAVGGDYAHPGDSTLPNVLASRDGGKTWGKGVQTNPAGLYFSAVVYEPEAGTGNPGGKSAAIAAGITGIYFLGPGTKWTRQSDLNFNSIVYAAYGTGWAAGPNGMVARWQ